MSAPDMVHPTLKVTRMVSETKNNRKFWVEQSPGYQRVTVGGFKTYVIPLPWMYFCLDVFMQDYADEKKFLPARMRTKEMYETSIIGTVIYAYSSPSQLVTPEDTYHRPRLWPAPVPNVSEDNIPCGGAYRNGYDELPDDIDTMVLANLVMTEYWDQSFNTDYLPRHNAWRMMGWMSQPWIKRWLSLEAARLPDTVFASWEKNFTLSDVLNKWPWTEKNRVFVPSGQNPVGIQDTIVNTNDDWAVVDGPTTIQNMTEYEQAYEQLQRAIDEILARRGIGGAAGTYAAAQQLTFDDAADAWIPTEEVEDDWDDGNPEEDDWYTAY